ncbi:MAG: ABC transporter permease [Oscillospiraceae bacterium]|jgi:lipopolysaccharide transport system permease protein|nr:ABC transporter permease [Oscillospiraceae bacterium]
MAGSATQKESVAVIVAGGRNLQYWKDLWQYRGLVWNMTARDFIVRYKQTVIGVAWSVINPLFNMLISTLLFGVLAGFGAGISIPYNVCVYVGGIPWALFARCFTQGSNVFLSGAELMKKLYFPRLAMPLSAMLSAMLDTAISVLLFFALLGFNALRGAPYFPPLRMLLGLPLLLPVALTAMFLGLFVGSFIIRWRDLNFVIPPFLQIAQYLSPVAYTMQDLQGRLPDGGSALSAIIRLAFRLNPASGFISAFKWAFLNDPAFAFDPKQLLVGFAWLLLAAVAGVRRFRRAERSFVDLI